MKPFLFLLNLLAVAAVHGQSLPGLTINGSSFTYDAPDGQVTGIIRMPSGNGPFPAVLISHGKGGSAAGFSLQHANILVTWGFSCIGPNYTHEGSTLNSSDNEGFCPENSRRARRCLEILASAPTVDMSRLALFAHSMGSFLSAGLAGEIPSQIKAVCLSAGGTSGTTNVSFASPATQEVQGITAPVLMFHGTADTTVSPIQSLSLQAILNGDGVSNKRLLYQGLNHDIINSNVKRADIHAITRAWFTQHGVLAFAGNSAPVISSANAATVASGQASVPLAITVGDSQTAASALTLSAFTTDDTRLPNSAIALGGTGANRTMTLTPPAGQTGSVEVVLVVDDGQLSAATSVQVTLENGGATAVNFRPEISWIADQRTTPGVAVSGVAFTVADVETPAASLAVTGSSSNTTLLPASSIVFTGNGANRTMALTPAAGQSGVATITVTVSDGSRTSATAFTLTAANAVTGNTPPTISALASESIAANTVFGPATIIVKDTEQAETTLVLTSASSNQTLVPAANVVLGGISWGRTVQVTPVAGQSGRATITLTISDGTNSASTAFVLDVISGSAPPAIASLPSVQQTNLGAASQPITFSVSDAETAAGSLRLMATSSNSALLPNGGIALGGSGANRTLTFAPLSGQTGAATVTLLITDGDYTRRAELLFVVNDPAGEAAQFSRPRGVFILDGAGPTNYTTAFGKAISLRDANMRSHSFVDGFTLRVAWSDVESSTTPGSYDFLIVQNALNKLPAGQRLSIIITPGEPDYIAAAPDVQTWSDAGLVRATPWDPYVRTRRRAMLQALGSIATNGIALRSDPRLDVLNPYLPGGFTGIRDPNSTPLRSLPGYTRQNFLNAVQDELRILQAEFPGKLVQVGFWPVTDNENATYNGLTASEWIRQQLLAEFDGIPRPRLGFFMENLAAKRNGPGLDPYSATPITGFASALFASRDTMWNSFQMLGSWTRPFNDGHVTNTLYGTPNDAMEYAFNTYRAEYHEVYIGDIDNASFQPALQRWHEFYASAGTTNRDSDEDGDGLPLFWEMQYDLQPTLADDPLSDRDRDGLSLLLEYAFDQNPVASSRGGRPSATTAINPTDGLPYLTVSYIRRTEAPQLSYRVEVSDDLQAWSSGPAHTQLVRVTPGGSSVSEVVTVRVLPAVPAGLPRRYARVTVKTGAAEAFGQARVTR